MEKKQVIATIITLLFLGSSLTFVSNIFTTEGDNVRLRARVMVWVCGERKHLPKNSGPKSIYTTEEEDILHIRSEGATLGDFFNSESQQFSNLCIYGYCNDNRCPDLDPDTLKMSVNGVINYEFGNYRPSDGDVIIIDYSSASAGIIKEEGIVPGGLTITEPNKTGGNATGG